MQPSLQKQTPLRQRRELQRAALSKGRSVLGRQSLPAQMHLWPSLRRQLRRALM